MYLIQENELKIVSVFNSQMTIWSSIGTALLTLAVSCIWDMATSDANTRTGMAFCFVAILCAAISFSLVWWNRSSRQGLLESIQKATRVKNMPEGN